MNQFLLFFTIFTIFPESKIREKIFQMFNKFWKNSQKSGTTFKLQNCLLEGLDNSNQVSTDTNNKCPTIINFNNYLKILNRARSLKYYHILTHAPPIYHIPYYCHIAIFHWLLFNFLFQNFDCKTNTNLIKINHRDHAHRFQLDE